MSKMIVSVPISYSYDSVEREKKILKIFAVNGTY